MKILDIPQSGKRGLNVSQDGAFGQISRAEFCAEMLATRERFHTNHLAILEKLDANHRELLAALERQATRINALEAGLARVDERTRKQR